MQPTLNAVIKAARTARQSEKTRLLLVGLEEEAYGGTRDGKALPLSPKVMASSGEFRCEPDGRNIEFSAGPSRIFPELRKAFVDQRRRLRRHLDELGGYVIVPGATIPMGDTSKFQPVDPGNPYYAHIEQTWGTNVVTAGLHLNVGLEDNEAILRAWRVIRCEASVFLALSAGSPFLADRETGYHSTRWHIFPPSPQQTPLFVDYTDYHDWLNVQVSTGAVFNSRNLWLSARPNGENTPFSLNRLELRICDRVGDPDLVLALASLLRTRITEVLEDRSLDPLLLCKLSPEEMISRIEQNERAVARKSLDAEIWDWQSDRTFAMRDYLSRYIIRASDHIERLVDVLRLGNDAMQWLDLFRSGRSIRSILAEQMEKEIEQEQR